MSRLFRVLALGAHTDDIELGCGATLNRLRRGGAVIATAAFSRAELSRPEGSPQDILEVEYRSAMSELGVPAEMVHCFGVPVREFHLHRQEILDSMIALRRDFDPDLILTMSSTDTHQDHSVVHQESVRAFRNRRLLAYHAPWNERLLATNYFYEVSVEDLEMKVRMLARYESQHALGRPYVSRPALESSLRFYGQQAGTTFAEAYEVLSYVDRACDGIA